MSFPWSDDSRSMRFDHFMAAALHDPVEGYYARRIRGVGHRGDFSTTASLSPVLGRAIAHWASDALKSTRCRDLIELGPGTGGLAADVLRNLPWLQRKRARIHLVETSRPLQKMQRERLGERVRIHASAAEALAACSGAACIYSNEFIDAFPVRRFRRTGESWQEQFVSQSGEQWHPSPDLPNSRLLKMDWSDGQIIEVHDSVRQWIQESLTHWNRGRMLTIDYGSLDSALYHRRPEGTLRGYFHHQLITGAELLTRAGHQDLTADVHFGDLIKWGDAYAEKIRCIPQSEFLAPHVDSSIPEEEFVSHPQGPGQAFLCLEQECR